MRAVYPVCGRCHREVHACVCRRVRALVSAAITVITAVVFALAVIAALAVDAVVASPGSWP